MVSRSKDQVRIERLAPCVRLTVYSFILIPKLVICFFLLATGTLYLAGTDNFADLVLNAVALQFVLNIDNWLFEAVFPKSIKDQMGNCVLVKPREPSSQAGHLATSVIYYAVILGGVALYLTPFGQTIPFFGIIPGYNHDAKCPIYWAEQRGRECPIWNGLRGTECFPFGPQTELSLG